MDYMQAAQQKEDTLSFFLFFHLTRRIETDQIQALKRFLLRWI